VIEEVTCEGEVMGLNLTVRVACEFCAKNAVTCDFNGDGWESKNFFCNFSVFFVSNFAECRALGKLFAECPTKNTQQRRLYQHFFYLVEFAVLHSAKVR
jgi:hypothetical protein